MGHMATQPRLRVPALLTAKRGYVTTWDWAAILGHSREGARCRGESSSIEGSWVPRTAETLRQPLLTDTQLLHVRQE